jgi:hypothetical protein
LGKEVPAAEDDNRGLRKSGQAAKSVGSGEVYDYKVQCNEFVTGPYYNGMIPNKGLKAKRLKHPDLWNLGNGLWVMQATMETNKHRMGHNKYALGSVPCCTTLPKDELNKLQQFVKKVQETHTKSINAHRYKFWKRASRFQLCRANESEYLNITDKKNGIRHGWMSTANNPLSLLVGADKSTMTWETCPDVRFNLVPSPMPQRDKFGSPEYKPQYDYLSSEHVTKREKKDVDYHLGIRCDDEGNKSKVEDVVKTIKDIIGFADDNEKRGERIPYDVLSCCDTVRLSWDKATETFKSPVPHLEILLAHVDNLETLIKENEQDGKAAGEEDSNKTPTVQKVTGNDIVNAPWKIEDVKTMHSQHDEDGVDLELDYNYVFMGNDAYMKSEFGGDRTSQFPAYRRTEQRLLRDRKEWLEKRKNILQTMCPEQKTKVRWNYSDLDLLDGVVKQNTVQHDGSDASWDKRQFEPVLGASKTFKENVVVKSDEGAVYHVELTMSGIFQRLMQTSCPGEHSCVRNGVTDDYLKLDKDFTIGFSNDEWKTCLDKDLKLEPYGLEDDYGLGKNTWSGIPTREGVYSPHLYGLNQKIINARKNVRKVAACHARLQILEADFELKKDMSSWKSFLWRKLSVEMTNALKMIERDAKDYQENTRHANEFIPKNDVTELYRRVNEFYQKKEEEPPPRPMRYFSIVRRIAFSLDEVKKIKNYVSWLSKLSGSKDVITLKGHFGDSVDTYNLCTSNSGCDFVHRRLAMPVELEVKLKNGKDSYNVMDAWRLARNTSAADVLLKGVLKWITNVDAKQFTDLENKMQQAQAETEILLTASLGNDVTTEKLLGVVPNENQEDIKFWKTVESMHQHAMRRMAGDLERNILSMTLAAHNDTWKVSGGGSLTEENLKKWNIPLSDDIRSIDMKKKTLHMALNELGHDSGDGGGIDTWQSVVNKLKRLEDRVADKSAEPAKRKNGKKPVSSSKKPKAKPVPEKKRKHEGETFDKLVQRIQQEEKEVEMGHSSEESWKHIEEMGLYDSFNEDSVYLDRNFDALGLGVVGMSDASTRVSRPSCKQFLKKMQGGASSSAEAVEVSEEDELYDDEGDTPRKQGPVYDGPLTFPGDGNRAVVVEGYPVRDSYMYYQEPGRLSGNILAPDRNDAKKE